MPLNPRHDVHLEFTSAFEMLDFVQVVSEHMGRSIGLDEDARHWVGVAVRESVINAIKHGNRNDASKRVFVDFEAAPESRPRADDSRPRSGRRIRSRASSPTRWRRKTC